MQAISKNVFGIMTFRSMLNFYVIVHGDTLSVIDTGMNASSIAALERNLDMNKWRFDQIRHILITHAHFDHIGGLSALQERCNAQTFVHRRDANIVRGSQQPVFAQPRDLSLPGRMMLRFASGNQGASPARVDTELHGDEILDSVLPGLQVIHLPGHSFGHCGFWIPDQRILIGRDIVMNLPWGVTHPIRAASPDWNGVQASIRRVCELKPQILCIGHGPVIRGDIAAKLQHLV